MRTMLAVGIGAGDPKYVTIQAIEALNRADVLFVVDKGSEKDGLVQLRREICDRYVTNTRYRSVQIEDPVRDRTAGAYREAVEDWRRRRADAYQGAIRDHLADGQCGALLVWGDPSLYDSTLAILDDVAARADPPIEYEVIPGISSVQALAARHKTTLNRVGGSVTVTTGPVCDPSDPKEMVSRAAAIGGVLQPRSRSRSAEQSRALARTIHRPDGASCGA